MRKRNSTFKRKVCGFGSEFFLFLFINIYINFLKCEMKYVKSGFSCCCGCNQTFCVCDVSGRAVAHAQCAPGRGRARIARAVNEEEAPERRPAVSMVKMAAPVLSSRSGSASSSSSPTAAANNTINNRLVCAPELDFRSGSRMDELNRLIQEFSKHDQREYDDQRALEIHTAKDFIFSMLGEEGFIFFIYLFFLIFLFNVFK